MNFDFSDEQNALRATVRSWVEKEFPFARRHALAKAGGGTRALYGELGALGLLGLAIPEAHGGLGLGAVEAMIVQEELGRGLVSAPYAQGALLAPQLLSAAPPSVQQAWLPAMASGERLVVLAHLEPGRRYRADAQGTRAQRTATGWALTGVKGVVPAGDEAEAFVVPAVGEAGVGLWLVERGAPGVTTRGYPTQDGARAAELTLAAAPGVLLTEQGAQALARALDVGVAAVCAEGVGVMEQLLKVTVEYLKARRQFGVALSTFQALRHKVADVSMQLELSRSMSYLATLKLQAPEAERHRAIAQARVQLGESMRFVGQQCIQLHGGIGVTDEYVASHFFKRLSVLEVTFGDTGHFLGEVAARMTGTAGVFV